MRSLWKAWLPLAVAASLVVGFAAPTASARETKPATASVALDATGSIGEALLKEAGKGLLSKGAGVGVSFALNAMGIGPEAATAAALAEIKAQLVRVNEQLTTLRTEAAAIQTAVLKSDYNNAAREALPTINQINHAEKLLRDAAALPPGHGQKIVAEEAAGYIKQHLLDKAALLASLAFGSGPASPDSVYTAASKARTADHFLSHEDSVQLRYLVDFYTAYEAAATQLTVTYYLTQKDYPVARLASLVDETTQSVHRQLASRRDAVPAGAAVDARTGLMWWTKSYGLTQHPGALVGAFAGLYAQFFNAIADSTQLKGWTLPTKDQLVALVSGWNGRPDEWLQTNGGFAAPMEEGEGGQRNPEFWTQTHTGHTINISGTVTMGYWVMDMRNAELHQRLTNGHLSQHGYIAVRATQPGSYLPLGRRRSPPCGLLLHDPLS